MKRYFMGILATFALLLQIPAHAIGLIIVDDNSDVIFPPPDRPGIPRPWLPRPIHRFTPLQIRSAQVTATIKDQVAHTKIEEEFYNPNPRRLEGTFILPLPKGAHLSKFALEINGKMTDAELLTAEKARSIYEEIVRKAKDPALLEYLGRDLIKVRIFPIEPNSSKKIELSYDQLLNMDAGLVQYSLPFNVAQYSSNPIESFGLKLSLSSTTPLKTIYSPSHAIEVLRNTDKTATIGLEETAAHPDKDFQLFYSAEKSQLGLSFLAHKKSGEDGYFMLLASPGFDEAPGKVLPKDVVFVLDTSGSMSGKKLEQAKKALNFCVNNLNRDDRFEIIRFSTETESLFRKLTAFSDNSRNKAEEFVDNLRPTGGTAINDALSKALEVRPTDADRPFLVVFLTDGLPTIGERSPDGILRTVKDKNRDLTRIFCFGIGTDVNTQLLDRIADETRAVSQYVLPDEDLEVKVSSFFAKISDPVLAGVELDLGDIRTSKVFPGKMPDLFKGQQLIVLGRYSTAGSTTAKVTGKVADREQTFRYKLEFPEKESDHSFIPRLWAIRRVGYLLDELRSQGENSELKDEVISLARTYGIVTPYTSFLVQEDQLTPARQPPELLHFYQSNPELMRRYSSPNRPEVQQRARELASSRVQSGDAAVAGSRYSSALKEAVTEQQVRLAGREVQLYTSTGKLQSGPSGPAANELLTKTAAGRTFQVQNGVWTEAAVSLAKDSTVERIRFNSPEYWAFTAAHPELREILALGTNVKFVLDGRVYEIHDTDK